MTGFQKPAVRRWSPVALTSVAALLTAFMNGPAQAQTTSFNAGNPTVASGSVTFDRGVTTPGTEVYTVNSRTAVLDFTPSDTAIASGSWINFQNAGTTVRYTNGPNTPAFTVLNRIVPTDASRPIQFNGRVISEIRAGATAVPGGDVWFYSPGGIVLGSTAAFDVGSLLLTARDPTGGTGVIGSTTSFRGGGTPGAFISLEPGASVNATSEGSYVAIVAPQIRQSGNVRVNGSAAYVAAEDATLTINAGLFSITIQTGTDGGTAINHQGSTTGPSSLGASDPHRIYMVAVPKNDAIQLFLGGNGVVGFDVATSATVENGRVILSSGRNVFEGQVVASPGAPPATVNLSGGRFTSNVIAGATTDAFIASTTGTATFTGNLTVNAGQRAHVGARRPGETLSIGGNLFVSTQSGSLNIRQSGSVSAFDFTGGQSLLYAENGGIVTVGGSVDVRADAYERSGSGAATFLNNIRGGSAGIFANTNGRITIAGNTYTSAFAGSANTGASYSNLIGGSANINTETGGTISLNGGSNQVWACGCGFTDQLFGSLVGGSITVRTGAAGGAILTPGFLSLNTNALVSAQNSSGGAAARGGSVFVSSNSGTISAGSLSTNSGAVGVGGLNATGGSATGGTTIVSAEANGSISIGQGGASLSSSASGGAGANAAGGNATAGTVQIQTAAGGSLTVSGTTSMSMGATGGSGSLGGGSATGGSALIFSSGTLNFGGLTAVASAIGGANVSTTFGGSGGDSLGGRAQLVVSAGTTTVTGPVVLAASGTGGSSTGAGGDGGDGTGGLARLDVNGVGARLTVGGNVSVSTSGIGGAGLGAASFGGDGFGSANNGSSAFNRGSYIFAGAGTLAIGGSASVISEGRGGVGGTGGDGIGGYGTITAYDGAISIAGLSTGSVSGIGGDSIGSRPGEEGGRGGDAEGGEFFLNAQANTGSTGSVRLGEVTIFARGQGGRGADGIGGEGGDGGNAVGGFIQSYASASSLGVTLGNVTLDASGVGGLAGAGGAGAAGQTGFAGGFGGDGFGGSVSIGTQSGIDRPANTGFHTFGNANLIADGVGGTGGAGGAGGAGAAGGRGGEGGLGGGGSAVLLVRGTPVTGTSLTMVSTGRGGTGGAGGAGATTGGAGANGDGEGGRGDIIVSNRFQRTERGRATMGVVRIDTSGIGGAATGGAGRLDVSGADVTFASLTYVSSGARFPANGSDPGSGYFVSVANGVVDVAGAMSIQTPGDVTASLAETGALGAASLSLNAGGTLLLRPLGGTVLGDLDIGSFSGVFGGDFTLEVPVDIAGGFAVSAASVTTASITAGGGVRLGATGDIRTGAITAGDSILLGSRSGSITTGALTTPRTVLAVARGDITLGDVSTGRGVNDWLYAGGSGIYSDTAFAGLFQTFGTFDAASLNTLGMASLPGTTLRIGTVSTGVFSAASDTVALGAVNASHRAVIFAPRLFSLSGLLTAPTISVASGDIEVGTDARIGGAGTGEILLSNVNALAGMSVGGDAAAGQSGYHLSNAEAQRLSANRIRLRAASGPDAPGILTVRGLTLNGSAASSGANLLGSNAELILAGDVVRVEGAVDLRGAGATDTLSLIGGRRVEVVTDRGGLLSVTGPGTGDVLPLAGTLSLSAPVIGVGTNALLTQLAADPRFAGRDALLSAAPTTPTPAGYVQANRLILTTSNVAAIQNSGTATTFGGFTAGLGGLLVRAPEGTQAGSTPPQVVVYGRVQRPGGGFYDSTDVGGGAAFETGQASLFDRNSTVNGCAVGASCGSEPAQIVATVSAIEEVLASTQAAAVEVPSIRVVQIVDQQELAVEPIITEPVSGAGNLSLWGTSDDDEDEDAETGAGSTAAGGQAR